MHQSIKSHVLIAIAILILLLNSMVGAVGRANAETLEEAWQIALSGDPTLEAALIRTEAAEQELAAAKARRLPNLNAFGGYTVLDNDPAFKVDIPFVPVQELPFAQDDSMNYQAQISLPLYTGGQITKGIEAASGDINAARAETRRTEADLKLDVARSYVAVLRAERAVETVEASVRSLVAHAEDVFRLFEQGLVAKNDLLASDVALSDMRQEAVRAHNTLDVARSAYNRLLNRQLTHTVRLEDQLPESFSGKLDTLTERAEWQRPELAALTEKIETVKNQAKALRGADLPQVAISGGFTHIDNRYLVHEDIWSATVGLKWDIFDGGVRRHKSGAMLKQADALNKLKADLASKIALQVRQAWLDGTETRRRMAVTETAVDQAKENLRVVRDRYRTGLGTNTEVIDAETMLAKSRTNYNNAVYDAVLADVHMKHATGDI